MSAMDKQLNNLINEYMPKRYYGHEARKYAKTIAIEYAKMCESQNTTSEPDKALGLFEVSNRAFIAEDPETEEQIIVNAYTIEEAISILEANGYSSTTEIRYMPLKSLHGC